MVLCLKAWKSRTSPGIAAGALRCKHEEITHSPFQKRPVPQRAGRFFDSLVRLNSQTGNVGAGWSSPVARQAHNLKVVGSNPTPATNKLHNLSNSSLARNSEAFVRLVEARHRPLKDIWLVTESALSSLSPVQRRSHALIDPQARRGN